MISCLKCGKETKGFGKTRMCHKCSCSKITSFEHRRKLSESLMGHPTSEEVREKLRRYNLGKKLSEETKRKMTSFRLGKKHSKEWCDNISKGQKGRKILFNFNNRERLTYPEYILGIICEEIFPDEYMYVGNGSFWIGRKNPDFKHVSEKKVIEVFGDYWHRNDNPQDRIDHFKKYGYECLVIWEHELNNFSLVEQKLQVWGTA